MDANEIIGKLIAQPKYGMADRNLLAHVVRDALYIASKGEDKSRECYLCERAGKTVNNICGYCMYNEIKPYFERAK